MLGLKELITFGCCIENKYFKQYCDLINQNKQNSKVKFETQSHHIFPISYYNYLELHDEFELVNLKYSEHVKAHYLLSLCSKEEFKLSALTALFHVLHAKDNYNLILDKEFCLKLDELNKQRNIYMSNLNSNKKLIHKNDVQKYVFKNENIEEYLKDGWELGGLVSYRHITKNNKDLMVQNSELEEYLNKGWKLGYSDNLKLKYKNKISIHLENEEKHIKLDELNMYLNLGWSLGRPESFKLKNKNRNQDTTFIYKDNKTKRIKNSDLDFYLNLGWKKGKPFKLIYIFKGNEEKHIKEEDLNFYLSQGWQKGTSLKTKLKISLKNKGQKAWNKGIKTSQESIEKRKKTIQEKYPDGILIHLSEQAKQKISNAQKNRIYISKNCIVKNIKKDELQKYLNEGWVLGRKG